MARGGIQEIIQRARAGEWAPALVLVGAERFLVDRATRLLKKAALGDGPPGFNDDVFDGTASLKGGSIVAAARTLPMMAQARFVLVRAVDKMNTAEQAPLADYVAAPAESTCLVLTADKLHGSSRLAKAAKKQKVLIDAKPLKGAALRQFAVAELERRGHSVDARGAQALVDAIGDDLAALDDAAERLSLYAGDGTTIGAAMVESCVSRIASDSIWTLVDAIGLRDAKTALGSAGTLLASREPALRILAMIARQLRMVARMREALASGLRGNAATAAAGAPPFKARDLTESARRFTQRDLANAFAIIADADLALKGSRVPAAHVLERTILDLCSSSPHHRERIPRRLRTYR